MANFEDILHISVIFPNFSPIFQPKNLDSLALNHRTMNVIVSSKYNLLLYSLLLFMNILYKS